MNWTTPADLRAQVQRLWDQGELLRACVQVGLSWPMRLPLKAPAPSDLSDRFQTVRDWASAVSSVRHVRIEWRERTHRVQGRQRLPTDAWLDSLDDALALIGQAPAAALYRQLWHQTATDQPSLLPWLAKHPLQALELADRWTRLLSVVAWVRAHPRPAIYLRQVDLPGVDTKFIEAHRSVLGEWLDAALPAEHIDPTATGAGQFARRYGFLGKPARLRFRLLDPAVASLPGCGGEPDITLDAASFAALALPVTRVFITENETNFLAFPAASNALIVFGAGYGWDALSRADWLHRCALYYWGDIDTHGFAILDSLRQHFPHAESFLMDRPTLLAHSFSWVDEDAPARHALTRLTPTEAALYDDLRFDQIRHQLRLEQERIGFGWVNEALGGLSAAPG